MAPPPAPAFAVRQATAADAPTIAGLAVAGDHQGQGVGTVLIARLERWAVDRGVPAIRSLSGSERTAAHQFYRHRGYRRLKTEQAFTESLPPG